jgi:two-component system sensor histidine kinase CreC
MKLSHRIFLGYFVVVALAGFFLIESVRDELRPAVRQSMEETLVDTANLLAELAAKDVVAGTLSSNELLTSNFSTSIEQYLSRSMRASIWGLDKSQAAFRIYITDDSGIVLYDSAQGNAVGDDYGQWNDVYLTLRGEYGARSTPSDPNDDSTSVMYVAAPIVHEGAIIGVLTVSKPNISVLPFIELSQRNIAKAGLIMLVVALVLGWLFSTYLSRSTRRLVDYANKVKAGQKAVLPHIAEQELSQLGDAIESMRLVLEGKEYVERYVHALTHEVKSPLTGIMGASELLLDDLSHRETYKEASEVPNETRDEMSTEDRARFIAIIQDETKRIQQIVERLLGLARVEQQQALEKREIVSLNKVVVDVVNAHAPQSTQRNIDLTVDVSLSDRVYGDAFLIHQAITNVVDNAMAFSPTNSTIIVGGREVGSFYELTIQDRGVGIPDYAQAKIFDRFYSLPRPDSGKKSSGLGLSFVREVMHLHQGDIVIRSGEADGAETDNSTQSIGCKVLLRFPCQ